MSGTKGTFVPGSGTINFDRAGDQSIAPFTYAFNDVILSGSGAKTMTNASITGSLSVEGSATVTMSAGQNLSVNSLSLGGLGRINGTWGSTSSIATYKTNTYFNASTVYINVATDTRSTPTITVLPTASSITYGQALSASTLSGGSASVPGTFAFTTPATVPNAGTYSASITFTPTDASTYKTTTSNVSVLVSPKAITVTADAKSKIYGSSDPTFTYVSSDLSATFTGALSRNTGENVGTYAITQGTLSAGSNYSITFVSANLTITAKPITVTADAKSKVYGASDPIFTYTSSDAGATFTGDLSRIAGTNVGTYAITQGTLSAGSNYSITFVSANLTITAKPITVTADAKTKVYGASDPTFTYVSSDLGATFTGALSRNTGENVGTYAITQGTLSAGSNYSITFVSANLAITVKAITVSGIVANDKDYDGTTVATLDISGASLVGLVFGDILSIDATSASATFASPNVGTNILVTISGLTLSGAQAGNYSLTQPTTTASIRNPLPTTTSISPASKNVGDGQFTLTVNGTNFVAASVVRFNGISKTTTFVNSTQLTAVIPASDLTATGNFNITVFNPTPGGGTSNAQTFTVNNPTPTTTSISPTSKILGASQFTLTVNGTNFVANSVVNFAGAAKTTTFVSSTQLTAFIPASDLTTTGTFDITVFNPTPGGGTSNAQTFTVNNPTPTTTGISPTNKIAGDADFTLTVNGTNFVANSVVNFAGAAKTTTFVSSTQLTAVIPASDLTSAGTFNITVSNPTPGGGTSNAQTFTVNPVPTYQFAINNVDSISAGSRAAYTITRQDHLGAPVVSGLSTVYLYSSSAGAHKKFYDAATGGNIITSIDITAGNSSVNVWYYDETPGTYTITASDNATAPDGATGLIDAIDSLLVNSGAVAQFYLNSPGSLTAGNRLGYTITRKDQFGNLVTSGATTAYLYSSSAGANKKFYDAATGGNIITSINITAGNSSADVWYYDETPGTYTITASDNATTPDGATGVIDATDSLLVNAGPTSQFILNDNVSLTVGNRVAYTITRKDQFGNLATTGSDTVYLYSTSAGVNKKFFDLGSGGNVITSIVIGSGNSQANVWYYDETPGIYTITASDNAATPDGAVGITDGADSLLVNAGALTQFTVNDQTAMTAGTRTNYTITRKDQFGNLITSGATTVYLYTSATGGNQKFYNDATAGSQISSIIIADGASVANVWYYDELAGSATVSFSDNSGSPDGSAGVADGVDSLTITPAAVGQFLLNDPGNMTAGTRLGYTLTRQDRFGNLVTAGDTIAYLYTSSSGPSSFYDAAANGNNITSVVIGNNNSTANFWYYDEATGNPTITASDNASTPDGATGVADATDSLTVDAAPIVATRFVILNPTDGVVGTPIAVTVQAQDNAGNIDTTYQNDITLLATGSATGAGLVDIINGVGTIYISDTVAQTVNLSLSDTQTTGLIITSIQNVVFAPGATAKFILNNPGDLVAGNRLAYTITRQDQYNNPVVAGSNTVYLYSNSAGASRGFYDAATNGNLISSIIITPGNSQASVWYYDDKVGNLTVAASDNATASDGAVGIADATDTVAVSAAPTSRFVLNNPGNMTAKTRLGYTVSREDQFGNPVVSGSANVYLYSNSTGSYSFYNAASGGSALTFVLIADNSSAANFWYYDNAPGTWTITASDNAGTPNGAAGIADSTDSLTVDAEPIIATRFVILPPANLAVGGSATITIEAQDDSGNIDTTFQTDITLITDGSATGGGLVNIVNGVGTKTITDAVAETVNLSLSDTQTAGLIFTSTQTIIFLAPNLGGSSGISIAAPTEVAPASNFVVSGRVYPNGVVLVTEKSAEGQVVKETADASATGSFQASVPSDTAGVHIYGITAKDKDGRPSQTKIFNADFTKIDEILKTIFMPPTIDVVNAVVTKGDFVKVIGYGNQNTKIRVQIDGGISYETKTDAQGAYQILINTSLLSLDRHSLQARQQDPTTKKYSDPSLLRNFLVSSLSLPKADLNGDGKIDARDLSIFNTLYKNKDKQVDLNNDGKIDLTDLSIFLRAVK